MQASTRRRLLIVFGTWIGLFLLLSQLLEAALGLLAGVLLDAVVLMMIARRLLMRSKPV